MSNKLADCSILHEQYEVGESLTGDPLMSYKVAGLPAPTFPNSPRLRRQSKPQSVRRERGKCVNLFFF